MLDLFDVGINCDGMNYLKNGLQYHPSVRQLLLARNDLGPKGAKVLIRVCVTMPLLEKLKRGATYFPASARSGPRTARKMEVL